MLFAIPVLLLAWLRENETLGRIGMWVVVLSGLMTIPVFLTGEPAEEMIEHLPGISEKLIKIHEETAEKALWFIGAASLAALGSLIYGFLKKSFPMKIIPAIAILTVCAIGFLAWTNNLGGEVHHPEIRRDKGQPTQIQNQVNEKEDAD
jgi:hypothetical protein